MIRVAKVSDIKSIVELGEKLHQDSTYCRYSFDVEKVTAFIHRLITSDSDGVVFVSEKGGVVTGGFMGGVYAPWFSEELIGFDYSFYLHPQYRHGVTAIRLMKAFEIWAEKRGAVRLHIGISTGLNVDGTTRLYERLGYKQSGVLFDKGVTCGN